jgi:hypothetical protein
MRARRVIAFVVLALGAVSGVPEVAHAQLVTTGDTSATDHAGALEGTPADGSDRSPSEPAHVGPPTRIVGFGTAFGGGGAAAGAYSPSISASSGVVFGPAIELPTFEVRG